jgi:hypothetical protein
MRQGVRGAALLVVFAAACGTQTAPPGPGPTKPENAGPTKRERPTPPAPAAGGRIAVHVQDMTKVLKLT